MLKPFAVEFQPFIDDITGKEKIIQECADMATMERIRSMFISIWYCKRSTDAYDGTGSSGKIAEMGNLLIDMRADMKPLFRLSG